MAKYLQQYYDELKELEMVETKQVTAFRATLSDIRTPPHIKTLSSASHESKTKSRTANGGSLRLRCTR
jgi:hypothetical protein